MKTQQRPAFTTTYTKRVNELRTKVGLREYTGKIITPQPRLQGVAIWDTGATGSAITSSTANKLNLIPIGKRFIQGANVRAQCNVYLVNIYLLNRVQIIGVPVAEMTQITGNFDVLIGMDIMKMGDLALTHSNNVTKLSFQVPSTHDIDFVRETFQKSLKHRLKILVSKAQNLLRKILKKP